MKHFFRLPALLLTAALLATGCGRDPIDPQDTPVPERTPHPGVVSEEYFHLSENDFISFPSGGMSGEEEKSVIPEINSTFDGAQSLDDTDWFSFASAKGSLETEGTNKYLRFTAPQSYASMSLELSQYITQPATYTVSFKYRVEGDVGDKKPFDCIIRTSELTSFSRAYGINLYIRFPSADVYAGNGWQEYSASFIVQEADLKEDAEWNLCLDQYDGKVTGICLDDVAVTYLETVMEDPKEPAGVSEAQTWVANEIVLISQKTYADPYRDVDVNMTLTDGTVTYRIPGFWDGGNVWRVRFMCPTAGKWSYDVACTDAANADLTQKGTVDCKPYAGPLAVYKRGHVTAQADAKYFVYADGTPFFYLGDTHWALSGEPLEHIRQMTLTRARQGFTVIQSQPIGAEFLLTDGVQQGDIAGLRKNDEKFKDIASKGLTHANAEFFFPSEMETFIQNAGGYDTGAPLGASGGKLKYDLSGKAKQELERLTRYWVARYAAFPVMWTLGQEVDKGYYHTAEDNWNEVNNPYKLVAGYIGKYDAYRHPLTGHQESVLYTSAENSVMKKLPEHTWFAVQWSDNYDKQVSPSVPQVYWSEKKPCVLYESKYCYMWTKNFGARLQGYMAYLNGMFGYGWGGQDTWCYQNGYQEDVDSTDGVDVITANQKQRCTWQSALTFESTYQLGYMRQFFEEQVGNWYELVPAFNSSKLIVPDRGAYCFAAATEAKDRIVVYFYHFSDASVAEQGGKANAENGRCTGTLKGLEAKAEYHFEWFDPRSNEIALAGTFTADDKGSWAIGEKKDADMVLFVYR